MFDWTNIKAGIDLMFSTGIINIIISTVVGLAIGIISGALPGITGTLAVALLLAVTYHLPPLVGIMFLSAIYTGSLYGGGIASTILNIPGEPAAVCHALDGYPMTKQGKCEEALGYGLMASIVGCVFSYLLLLFFMRPLGRISLSFGPPELVLVVFFALTVIGALGGSVIKGLIGGFLGLLLGSIGPDIFAIPRGTFGLIDLMDGIQMVPAMVGIFALPEIFELFESENIVESLKQHKTDYRRIVRGALDTLSVKNWVNIIRSTLIGFIIGIIPATGGTVSSMLSYIQAKLHSKKPETFGKGNPEGIIAAGVGSNAAEGGAMAVMLTFGIPGSATAAVMIGAFILHGIAPGPSLVREHMDIAYSLILLNIWQTIIWFPLALLFIPYMAKAAQLPNKILIPVITMLTFVGAFAERLTIFDIGVLFVMGLVGYVMRKLNYPQIAVILGLVLSNSLEFAIIRSHRIFSGRYLELLNRPLFILMLVLIVLSIVFSSRIQRINKQTVDVPLT